MSSMRGPAVAGTFYPADPRATGVDRAVVARRGAAERAPRGGALPKAIIAPHAGYAYSGPIAASAYAAIAPLQGRIGRVVLMGPAHRVRFDGLAASTAGSFLTPLGEIQVDQPTIARLLELPQVWPLDAAHAQEHCLEVHLPFLQEVLGEFRIVPLVVGRATAVDAGEIFELLWDESDVLFVVSSDLSHYYEYATAQELDRATADWIESLAVEASADQEACGRIAIGGLLAAARRRGLRAVTLDLRNSGDTAGPRDRVVGYGAFVIA